MSIATEEKLEALVSSRLPEADPDRVEWLGAVTCFVGAQVLADHHLSASEERSVRNTLTARRHLSELEARVVVELLQTQPDAVLGLSESYWVGILGPWIAQSAPLPTNATQMEYRSLLRTELALRWPLLVEPSRLSCTAQGLDWDKHRLHLGSFSSMNSVSIQWSRLESLEAVDPWPRLLVEWRERQAVQRLRVRPSFGAAEFSRRVSNLFEVASNRVRNPSVLRHGWLSREEIPFEQVEGWPQTASSQESPGDYRSAPRAPEKIIAHRPPKGGLGRIMQWLASSPTKPFRLQPVEAATTETHLYVRRGDGRVERIGLENLANRLGFEDGLYIFGRSTQLLLTDRAQCPVASDLDQRLNEKRRADH